MWGSTPISWRCAPRWGIVAHRTRCYARCAGTAIAWWPQSRCGTRRRRRRLASLLAQGERRPLLRHEAQRQPLVLAVEDVPWIDPTSEAWLGFLVERLGGMAVLLLLTQRPGYQPPWGAHAAMTQLALPPLPAEDSQAIVAAV